MEFQLYSYFVLVQPKKTTKPSAERVPIMCRYYAKHGRGYKSGDGTKLA